MRTFIQRGSVSFEGDLDNVKAYDSGLMTDSTKASYHVAYTCRWTGADMDVRVQELGVYAELLADTAD